MNERPPKRNESRRVHDEFKVAGCQVLALTSQPGAYKICIPEGSYGVRLGFPAIAMHDNTYLYGNNDPEVQGVPFKFDLDHPSVRALFAEVEGRMHTNQEKDLASLMCIVRDIIKSRFVPDVSDENIRQVSEIVLAGRSACAGLTLVAGLCSLHANKEVLTSAITGSPFTFDEVHPLPYLHQWLRVAKDNEVVLYDPFYDVLRVYVMDNESVEHDDPFLAYRVFAWGASAFLGGVVNEHTRLSKNLDVIERQQNLEVWLNKEEYSLAPQIAGEMNYSFFTTGAEVNVQDGAMYLQKGEARIPLPVKQFARL